MTKKAEKGQDKATEPEAKVAKEPKVTHITIKCADCGVDREIKVQDKHQVTRCTKCQDVHRKEKRKEYRKNLIRNLRGRVEELEQVLTDNGIDVPE